MRVNLAAVVVDHYLLVVRFSGEALDEGLALEHGADGRGAGRAIHLFDNQRDAA